MTIERELELIEGMIEVQLHHAAQCDAIQNRKMAEKQKGWDMERVALLRKMRAALDAQPQFADPDVPPKAWLAGDGHWVLDEDKQYRPDKDRFKEAVYAADQMRAYGAARVADAVLAERERCIDLVALFGGSVETEAAIRRGE
jgi:hypothetical protein